LAGKLLGDFTHSLCGGEVRRLSAIVDAGIGLSASLRLGDGLNDIRDFSALTPSSATSETCC